MSKTQTKTHTQTVPVFDCLPIYYLLIRAIPDSIFIYYKYRIRNSSN